MLGMTAFVVAILCGGCLGPKTGEIDVNNVFDEMLACDIVEFSEAADATYIGEWRKLDDGFELKSEEEGVLVRYGIGRNFDDDGIPYKLTLSKRIYVPVSDGSVMAVTVREVYSAKTGALREGDTSYAISDPRDQVDLTDPTDTKLPYVQLSAEEAEAELERAGVDELASRLMGSPNEYFVDLYHGCMDSSFSAGCLGVFEDRREQATGQG